MTDTELVVRVASSGTAKTVRDVLAVQSSLEKVAKSVKDTRAYAEALGKAFNLPSDDVRDLAEALESVKRETAEAKAEAGGLSKLFDGIGQGIGQQITNFATNAIGGAIQGVKALVASTLSIGGAAQQSEVAFKTMLGSADAAQKTLADLTNFAATTPFEFPEIRQAGQSLLAFGVQAGDLTNTLTKVGNVASGVGVPIGELAQIYGKAKTQGRLFAEDINQLTGRGIPIIQELAKQFGVSEQEVKKLVESGKVGFPQLEQAFTDMTSEGGKFFNLMAEQSKTVPGQISNLSDRFTQLQKSLFDAFAPALSAGLQLFSDVLNEAAANSNGLDPLVDAGNRLKEALEGNPELAEALGRYLATLTDSVVSLLANGLNALATWLDENPDKVVNFFDDLSNGITTIGKLVNGLTSAVSLLQQFIDVIPGADGVLEKLFDANKFGPFTSQIELIKSSLTAVVGLMERAGLIAPRALEAGVGGAAKNVASAVGALNQSLEALGQAKKPEVPTPDPDATENALKRLVDANRDALQKIELDNTNAKAALLEGGGTQAEIAAKEEEGLQKRVQANRQYLAQLQQLQQQGGLKPEEAAKIADAIASTEDQLAKDRVTAAQSTVAAQKAVAETQKKAEAERAKAAEEAEKKRIEAAEEAEKKRIEAAKEAAKTEADSLKEKRDTEKQAAEDQFQTQQQAKEETFNQAQESAKDLAQKKRQEATDSFNREQEAKAKAFEEQLQAAKEKRNREFQALETEADRRFALATAENAKARKEIIAEIERTSGEDAAKSAESFVRTNRSQIAKVLKEDGSDGLKNFIERGVLAQQDSILAGANTDLSPLEQARAESEAKFQKLQEEFRAKQQVEQQTFETALNEAEDAFEAKLREDKRIFAEQQRNDEAAFKQQQRDLDKQNAQAIAEILKGAESGGVPIAGARRLGGPVDAGKPYLVGEEGPELVVPRKSGYVMTAAETAAMLRGVPMGRMSVPTTTAPSNAAVVAKLDAVLKAIEGRPAISAPLQIAIHDGGGDADARAIAFSQEHMRSLMRGLML